MFCKQFGTDAAGVCKILRNIGPIGDLPSRFLWWQLLQQGGFSNPAFRDLRPNDLFSLLPILSSFHYGAKKRPVPQHKPHQYS